VLLGLVLVAQQPAETHGGIRRELARVGEPSRKKGYFQYKTLDQAERCYQRVTNMVLDRERSEVERVAAIDERTVCEKLGKPPEEWPPIPTLRGLSRSSGAFVVSALNGFCASRKHQDEFVAKAEVEREQARVIELLGIIAELRQKVAEQGARIQMGQN
jgi:hypothetical protein